ncbi:major facilitator superfamily MFS_1 [Catenulispora acidiphila DSM 44928]|uniref:Major facilitator superfamily MFS_1 n=1 Tax=Catenulispora acidiphila (strain DSM 44928 / JCM 14897 / NBRC 102108 / NRRL B-24433 / ID139908) TaxID=479433 RepID=C7Q616_CATAD|nr:MFS transporter [Catenulispora acidiphila]ACU70113.1 major facilitator superfamily MFS_1 [Catenulispora acidiphila DSM 44928]
MLKLITPYKPILAIPGTRALFVVAFVARLPLTAKSMALTLHVVLDQGGSYAAAGLASMVMTIGMGVGSPMLGRMVDHRGLKPVLLLTGASEAVYWVTAPFLPYPVLLGTTFLLGGVLGVPVFSIIRQAVAARVPDSLRRQAFALDSMIVELVFMVGPALAIATITSMHTATATMAAIGILTIGSVVTMWLLNPPIGHHAAGGDGTRPEKVALSTWVRPAFVLVLATGTAANLVLAGTDISITALLRQQNAVSMAGVCIFAWCLLSLIGGFWHGSTQRPWRLPVLMLLLGAGTIPVGFIGQFGWWWLALILLPAGFMCAPTLSSTAEAVAASVPASARGQAMGLQGSAMTLGGAIGAPLAGTVVDASSPPWAFATTGAIGVALAAAMLAYQRFAGPAAVAAPMPTPAAVPASALVPAQASLAAPTPTQPVPVAAGVAIDAEAAALATAAC